MPEEKFAEVPLVEVESSHFLRKEINPIKFNELVASIEQHGLLYPVRLLRGDPKYLVVDGTHRILAFLKLGRKTIPAILETQSLDEAGRIVRGLSANSHRSDNSPLEKAEALARLIELTGWTASQVAETLAYSSANVTKLLACLQLPAAIRERLHAGEIGLATAYELTKVSDPARQVELASQVASGQLTRDRLTSLRKTARNLQTTPQTTPKLTSRATAMLRPGCSITVASEDLTLERFIELIEELLSKARRGRTQHLELGTFIKMLRDQARLT